MLPSIIHFTKVVFIPYLQTQVIQKKIDQVCYNACYRKEYLHGQVAFIAGTHIFSTDTSISNFVEH